MTRPTNRIPAVSASDYVAQGMGEKTLERVTVAPKTPTKGRKGMSAEERREWKAYLNDPSHARRNALIERYHYLALALAGKLAQQLPPCCDRDELYAPAVEGLMRAIDMFDPARGVKFETYCALRIRGSVMDFLRRQDITPRRVRGLQNRIESVEMQFEAEHGRKPSRDELKSAMGMCEKDFEAAMRKSQKIAVTSLDAANGPDDAGSEGSRRWEEEDRHVTDPMQMLAHKDLMQTIRTRLKPQSRIVLTLYYHENMTMKEIGDVLQLSESRVSQIHSQVLCQLRSMLERVLPEPDSVLAE